uniref:SKP1-like protein n=2 Tax=Lactuca sativa TaxID=4236 RepID=A0A9R1UVJ1_LACSA|nr:hypothetical protein LSAT_V11C800438970 [Lactuca sativa]
MSRIFHYLEAMLLILISISVFTTVSSRPIATGPEGNVAATSVILKSSDGEKFDVKLQVALQSEAIKQMIIDGGFSSKIELSFPNITGEIMAKVLDYCHKHVYYDGAGNNLTAVEEMKVFDTQFVDVHYETLFKLVLASNELKIKSLLDLVSGRIAIMIKGKEVEEIREMFNIKQGSCVDHFTKQDSVRENGWAFG